MQIGFENDLWAAADKLRGKVDSAEYKHVVLGLVFLKFASEIASSAERTLQPGAASDPETTVTHVLVQVPDIARWPRINDSATPSNVAELLDKAMIALEDANPSLSGILPRGFADLSLDSYRLVELIQLFNRLELIETGNTTGDVLGRVYEYFLNQFARAEGQRGGEFYTPRCVVQLLVEMLAPYHGTVYDPCCGSGGMFVQSKKFVEMHGGTRNSIAIYGQESNPLTWRLAKMNLTIRGIEANLGSKAADTFTQDLHSDLKADYILANPPFNMSDWGQKRLEDDPRWKFGLPPRSNANFAWIQHFVSHLASDGMAGFVLANGSMSVSHGGEGSIRQSIVEADLVDCIVALPGQLFYSTQIPVSLWFLSRNKADKRYRNRRHETLFIDASSFGYLTGRVHRILTENEICKIAQVYHSWRGDEGSASYDNIPGFAASCTIRDIKNHKFALVPGRYVGFSESSTEWSRTLLRDEFDELENRVEQSQAAAQTAINILRELIYG